MTRPLRPVPRTRTSERRSPSRGRLDRLVEQATIDAYSESEQCGGFFTMLEEHLALPFKTEVPGVQVSNGSS